MFARVVLTPLRQFMVFVVSDEETQTLLQELGAHLGISPDFSLSEIITSVASKPPDAQVRAIVWKLIRTTWRHGLSDLWRLRKPPRPLPIVEEGTAG